MLVARFEFFSVLSCVLFASGCATVPSERMSLCYDSERANEIKPEILAQALVKATTWSTEIYGADCFVCAEILPTIDTEFTLHITSPFDDMILNTSATMTFRATNADVVDTAKYHSCQARIKRG